MPTPVPVTEAARIQSLDVLRGFALCGILLLNVIAFGLHSAAYFNPVIDGATQGLNLGVWATVDILFEGSMRCLFSMLFGAGVVLFTAKDRGAALHFRRNLWLFAFGLFDIFILLWHGDILTTYAIAGAILYFARNLAPRRLLIGSAVMIVLMSAQYAAMGVGLASLRDLAENTDSRTAVSSEARELLTTWEDFKRDFDSSDAQIHSELALRQSGYGANFNWVANKSADIFLLQIPVFMLWDALAMMLLGMALYNSGVLSATRPTSFYIRVAAFGFAIGLITNIYEVITTVQEQFDILRAFSFTRPTYQLGRLGMAAGYLALVMLACKLRWLPWLMQRLGAVGRMALTNYLCQSLICLVIFVGFALVGRVERWALYTIVLAIWIAQLLFSHWWLQRYRFGPLEWLWRAMTYGHFPAMRRLATEKVETPGT